MKLLFENWRQYLTEVSFAAAREILNSKGTIKIIKNYEYLADEGTESPRNTHRHHDNFKQWLLFAIPDDITDNQKGTALLWLRGLAKKDEELAKAMITHTKNNTRIRGNLETFFHHQRFFPHQDLMQIKSIDDLNQMADEAKEDIEAHRQTQISNVNLIDDGTTFLSGGWNKEIPPANVVDKMTPEEQRELLKDLSTVPGKGGWVIMEIHNKAASCFHGTADWCTAQPSLDYFEDYYKPTDPLFIFQRVPDIDKDRPQFLQRGHKAHPGGEEKYQFHYGTKSFMDAGDHFVDNETWNQLHNLLMQTAAPEKYPVVQNHHYYMVAEDRESSPEELDAIAKNPDVPGSVKTRIARNPATSLETLEYLSRSDNSFIKRAVQLNSTIDMGLTIELFVNNPTDSLIHQRGIHDIYDFVGDGRLSDEQANQIIDNVKKARLEQRGDSPVLFEHKIKIRIKR